MRNEVNFQMVLDNKGYEERAAIRLADEAGIPSAQLMKSFDRAKGMTLYKDIEGKRARITQDCLKFFDPRIMSARKVSESRQTLRQKLESWLGVKSGCASFGMHIPSYLEALTVYKDSLADPKRCQSVLLAGALTSDTVVEAYALMQHVFSDVDFNVIDREGERTKQATKPLGKFHKGDVLEMPFGANEYDVILGDYLLPELFSQKELTPKQKRDIFFVNAASVLRPGGALVIIDSSLPSDFRDTAIKNDDGVIPLAEYRNAQTYTQREVIDGLKRAGFKVAMAPLKLFNTRRDMERAVMLGNRWDLSQSNIVKHPLIDAYFAIKKS